MTHASASPVDLSEEAPEPLSARRAAVLAENRKKAALARSLLPPPKKRRHRVSRAQLLTREMIDGRSNAAKAFDQLAAQIHQDLGGFDRLSAVQVSLVNAFCAASIVLEDLNTRLLLGEPIDRNEQCSAISSLCRLSSRLGLRRVPRDLSPTLSDYLRGQQIEHEDTAA